MLKQTGLLSLIAIGLSLNGVAEEKPNVVEATTDAQVTVAEIAARLVLKGESEKSPLLLLAAADLLDTAKESERDASKIASDVTGEGEASTKKSAPAFSRKDLEARSLELATSDAEKTLVQEWIDRPRPRGITAGQGANLDSIKVENVTHKVIFRGVIDNGYKRTFSQVQFEGKVTARVIVIGDGDGDLDLRVYDANTGGLIGSDTDSSSTCVVSWIPRYQGPFRIEVNNAGSISERCIILVNW